MKNRAIGRDVVSEWEDNIIFDADDPDFCSASPNDENVLSTKTLTLMAQPPIVRCTDNSNNKLNVLTMKGK